MKNYEVSKSNEGHFILAPVLIPLVQDKQGDIVTIEEVEKACLRYNASQRRVFKDHVSAFSEDEARVVESYVAPGDFFIGSTRVTKGTWVCRFKVSEDIYKAAIEGRLAGFSVAGQAQEVA